MTPRAAHSQNKTPEQRHSYQRYIEVQDYEPTKDEDLSFPQTGQAEEEFGEPTTKSRRGRKLSTKLEDHFTEHWINWLVSIFAIILAWLMINSRIDIATIFEKFDAIKNNLLSIKTSLDANSINDHRQDLIINENKIRIEYFKKSDSSE